VGGAGARNRAHGAPARRLSVAAGSEATFAGPLHECPRLTLRYVKSAAARLDINFAMKMTFLYRCPTTGLRVQGLVVDADGGDKNDSKNDERYEAVTCLACGQVHLVNPKTGRVVGEEKDATPKIR
jgi:hypothetical protein